MTQAVQNPGNIAPTVYDPTAAALFARMSSLPSLARRQLISTLISNLKAIGFWSTLRAFNMVAAHSAQAALLNWTGNTAYDAQIAGTPTFTPDKGYGGFSATNIMSFPVPLTAISPDTSPAFAMAGQISTANAYAAGSTASARALINFWNGGAVSSTPMLYPSASSTLNTWGSTLATSFIAGPYAFGKMTSYAIYPGKQETNGTDGAVGSYDRMQIGGSGAPGGVGVTRMSLFLITSQTVSPTIFRRAMTLIDAYLEAIGAIE